MQEQKESEKIRFYFWGLESVNFFLCMKFWFGVIIVNGVIITGCLELLPQIIWQCGKQPARTQTNLTRNKAWLIR